VGLAAHRRLNRTLLGAVLSAALSGCLPLPYPDIVSKAPDITAKLPSDLLASPDETLVLAQVGKDHGAIGARFMKGSELRSLDDWLMAELHRGTGVVVISLVPMVPYVINASPDTYESVREVCILAPDGRVIAIDVASESSKTLKLYRNRRDAIASALRGGGKTPFETVDAPCSLSGETDWPSELRERAAEYISSMPAIESPAYSSPLGQMLVKATRDDKRQAAQRASVMVLAATEWRGELKTEPPIFVVDGDFDSVAAAVQAATQADILQLLPSDTSGARALKSVSLAQFCVVSADGRILRWNDDTQEWQNLTANSGWWPNELVSFRGGQRGSACAPGGTAAWTTAERRRAITFLENVREEESPKPAIAQATLRNYLLAPGGADRAGYLLIAVDRSAPRKPLVVPLFLQDVRETDLVEPLNSVQPAGIAQLALATRATDAAALTGFQPDRLCLVSITGKVLQFEQTEGSWTARDQWWEQRYRWIHDEALRHWRRASLDEVHADGDDHGDADTCWLGAHENWPPALRAAVTRFLERLPDAPLAYADQSPRAPQLRMSARIGSM